METNSQRLQLAICAVSKVAPQGVVFQAVVRHGVAWLTRKVAISLYLTSVGVPVIVPSRELAPGLYQRFRKKVVLISLSVHKTPLRLWRLLMVGSSRHLDRQVVFP